MTCSTRFSEGATANSFASRDHRLSRHGNHFGLAGGSGTYAFLIGVGWIGGDGFRVRQFFMRDYDEEASQLHALSAYLARFQSIVTYNACCYDQPLL